MSERVDEARYELRTTGESIRRSIEERHIVEAELTANRDQWAPDVVAMYERRIHSGRLEVLALNVRRTELEAEIRRLEGIREEQARAEVEERDRAVFQYLADEGILERSGETWVKAKGVTLPMFLALFREVKKAELLPIRTTVERYLAETFGLKFVSLKTAPTLDAAREREMRAIADRLLSSIRAE